MLAALLSGFLVAAGCAQDPDDVVTLTSVPAGETAGTAAVGDDAPGSQVVSVSDEGADDPDALVEDRAGDGSRPVEPASQPPDVDNQPADDDSEDGQAEQGGQARSREQGTAAGLVGDEVAGTPPADADPDAVGVFEPVGEASAAAVSAAAAVSGSAHSTATGGNRSGGAATLTPAVAAVSSAAGSAGSQDWQDPDCATLVDAFEIGVEVGESLPEEDCVAIVMADLTGEFISAGLPLPQAECAAPLYLRGYLLVLEGAAAGSFDNALLGRLSETESALRDGCGLSDAELEAAARHMPQRGLLG